MDQPDAAGLPESSLTTEMSPTPGLQPPLPPSTLRRVFVGPDGIRSGWRLLLYLLIFLAIGAAFGFLARLAHLRRLPMIWNFLSGEVLSLVAAVVPAFIMAWIEKRSFGVYGLPRRGAFGRPFWLGALWGIVALTVLMLAMRGSGAFYFGGLALHGTRILEFAAFWGFFFVVVGLFEEFVLRGYAQFTLTRGIGFWPSALLLSTAFGAIHINNQGESLVGVTGAGLIGLFFCLTLRRTGDLWFAVGLHASWDWGETFLYSVPNSGLIAPGHLLNSSFHGPRWLSGGSVGPEGSVLVFVIIIGLWVIFDRVYPQAKYAVADKPQIAISSS